MIFGVMRRLRRRPQVGFSLVEAAIGLALIGVALLLTVALMAQQPWIERRLAAHQDALGVMDAVLEELRSGVALPGDGELDLTGMPRSTPPAAQGLRIWIVVDKQPERRLYDVRLTARYAVGDQFFETVLESMVFSP